jgi:hypothetical protein
MASMLPSVVVDGCVFSIDPANTKSYGGTGLTTYSLVGGTGGSLYNGVGFTSTNAGSFVFDGTNDYINTAFPVANNADFSISFWMNYQDITSSTRGLISTWDTSWNGFGIGTYLGNIRSWTNNGAGGGLNWAGITTNTWQYYTLTYNYSTKTQFVYKNASYLNSETRGTSITHSALQIACGGQQGSTQLTSYPYLKCQISQLSVYNRVLSATEILQNFNALRGRYGV